MNLKDTTLSDVLRFMYKNQTGVVNVDFEIKGMKASLEIALVSRRPRPVKRTCNLWSRDKQRNNG